MYICCSDNNNNNNKSSTVLRLFIEATTFFGVPSRFRSDQGGGNVEVARYKLINLNNPRRGPGCGSMITGRSVHNQRIEHLWRDVFTCILKFLSLCSLFTHLEECEVLNPNDDVDLFCLHYVCIPRINNHLKTWRYGGNNHTLSGQSRTPLQLWTEGTLNMIGSNHTPAQEMLVSVSKSR